MIISRTPFRVSFFGGGTDYPEWFRENGGCVLSSSINHYCYLTCRYLPPFFEHKSRIVWSQIELVEDNEKIRHPVVKAVLEHLRIERGIEIFHHGDLPARSGLGSSSAFTVGLLHALHGLQGKIVSKHDLAMHAIEVEQGILKENVGIQDQVETAFGGFNRIDIRPDGSFDVCPLLVSDEYLAYLQDSLLLFYTGISRHASEIAAAQISAIPNIKSQLRAMQNLVSEAEQAIASEDMGKFGALLHETWELKRSLSPRITSQAIDDVYEHARNHGAMGGKLLGAGGGGFLMFLVEAERRTELINAMEHLLHVPIKFDRSGTQIIHYENTKIS